MLDTNNGMLDALRVAVSNLPDLLKRPEDWRSLYIDYHPPIVERAYINFAEKYRINLHRIHPIDDEDTKKNLFNAADQSALYHPHPWPSAMLIVKGVYETRVGYGDPNGPPPPMSGRLILSPGTMYEMTDPREWHYVSPAKEVTYTIMVTGEPYPNPDKQKTERKQLRGLTEGEFFRLYEFFEDEAEQEKYLEAIVRWGEA